ncbi:MAG: response regulator, partial [Clostridia bacterium]|nr:response regulator [Clostridia bacterium]
MFKIMVVEDDAVIRETLGGVLTKWNFEVKSVENFNDVFSEFSKHLPHLVLMDINLPYFDGFYWCNKIREVSKVPIVFISSRTGNMDIVMA